MTTPEGKVKAKVKKLLKEFNAYQFWPVQSGYGNKTLDCLACVNGKFIGIETKAPGKGLTPLQASCAHDIERASGRALRVGTDVDLEQLRRLLERVSDDRHCKSEAQGGGSAIGPGHHQPLPVCGQCGNSGHALPDCATWAE